MNIESVDFCIFSFNITTYKLFAVCYVFNGKPLIVTSNRFRIRFPDFHSLEGNKNWLFPSAVFRMLKVLTISSQWFFLVKSLGCGVRGGSQTGVTNIDLSPFPTPSL